MDTEFKVSLTVIETYLNISTHNKGELIYVASCGYIARHLI